MSRPDLASLSADALTVLANAGLVKRAQRELSQGLGPTLDELADTTVVATFPDGIVTRAPHGADLTKATCSCGSVAMCRHRVALALAWHDAHHEDGPLRSIDFSDAQLRQAVTPAVWRRAHKLSEQQLPTVLVWEPLATARLATCTVRFLVANDLAYARCDCSQPDVCEHIVVAAWAFRNHPAQDIAPHVVADLSTGSHPPHPTTEEGDTPPPPANAHSQPSRHVALTLLEPLVDTLLTEGVAHAGPSLSARFSQARSALVAAGMAWMIDLVDEIDLLLKAYQQRSARYHATDFALRLTEVTARARAADGPLHARDVLGVDTPLETRLERVRLIGLGARLHEEQVDIFLTDPSTGVVVVVRHAIPPDAPGPQATERVSPASRRVAPGVLIGPLASGQIVSQSLKRRANHRLVPGRGPHSVAPHGGRWDTIAPPVRVPDLEALTTHMRTRPPRILRARLAAEDVHVLRVSRVDEVVYAPGAQRLTAWVSDHVGSPFRLEQHYHGAARHALDSTARALRSPALVFISGVVRLHASGLIMEPLALSLGDRVVVPDLAVDGAAADLSLGYGDRVRGPLEQALLTVEAVLAEAVHDGLMRLPNDWIGRVRGAARTLDELSLTRLAADLHALAQARRDDDLERAARLWRSAAVRLAVTMEQA